MLRSLMMVCVLSLVNVGAQATLVGRSALTPGGTDYRAYYDDVLNITWLSDANLAATNTFGISGICTDSTSPCLGPGTLTWAKANEWIAAMNTTAYLGVSDWQLPEVKDTGAPGCNFAYTGTDCGYNVDLSTSEMAHLFYSTLGNTGSPTGCTGFPLFCLTNKGPFSNLFHPQNSLIYWSGTTYAPNSGLVWYFHFGVGLQDFAGNINNSGYAWAVAPNDPLNAPIPIPPAVLLFGSALGLMGVMRRKISS